MAYNRSPISIAAGIAGGRAHLRRSELSTALPSICVVCALALAAACGTSAPAESVEPAPLDGDVSDAGTDSSPTDATTDATPSDLGTPDADAGTDPDLAPDGADADAEPDADVDVEPDVTPDAIPDVEPDLPPPTCDDRGPVTLSTDGLEVFYWAGESPEIARVGVEANLEACGPLALLADSPLIDASLEDGDLVVRVDPATINSGIFEVNIFLSERGGELILATLELTLRVMAPGPGAEPRVLFVGIDGMRPDAMLAADTPTYDALMEHAAWSPEASTHLSTSTDSSAGWTSLVTGVDSDKHGVLNNSSLDLRDYDYATFAQRATDAGLTVSLIAQWAPFATPIHEAGAATFRMIGGYDFVVEQTVEELETQDRELTVVHLDEVDHAGHATGFSPDNPAYIEAIELHDAHTGQLLDTILARETIADEDWLILVVTDHGGRSTSHGPMDIWRQRIGLIFAGTSRSPGVFHETVTQMDVFPTVLDHLGIAIDPSWDIDGVVRGVAADEVGPWVAPTAEELCVDGFDDDFDRLIDCDDPDCAESESCVFTCPTTDISDALGEVATGTYDSGASGFITGSCAPGGDGEEATLAWVAPSTGSYVIDTIGSEIDTLLYVLESCEGEELACNDDAVGLQSQLTLDAEEGDAFVIVVDPYRVASLGDWVLNIELVPAICAETDLGSEVGELASGSNAGTTTDYLIDCGRLDGGSDVSFLWTAPSAGDWTFDTLGSDFDTMLAVFDGECTTASDRLACNDDTEGFLSSVTVTLDEGQAITVVVAGFDARTGDYVLNVSAAP